MTDRQTKGWKFHSYSYRVAHHLIMHEVRKLYGQAFVFIMQSDYNLLYGFGDSKQYILA